MAPDDFLAALKQVDYDRYLSTLYAPPDKRASLAILYAFNAEIASIRDRAREPLTGELRLQWWRDALSVEGAAGGHPLAEALAGVIDANSLPVSAFLNMLDARVFDLYNDPMPSRNDLEGYCGETASALIQLAALILDREAATNVASVTGHAGCAQAITGLTRLLPIHRARGQCYVPAEILAASGSTVASLLEGAAGSEGAVLAMAALARQHLEIFRREAGAIPPKLRPAFLPLALTDSYLSRIENDPIKTLRQVVEPGALGRHLRMLRKAARGW